MTRLEGFDVRVAPEVWSALRGLDRSDPGFRSRFVAEMRRLKANGTRARSAKKLSGFELWEMRVGNYRAFLSPVPGSRRIAVGALVGKDSRRLRAQALRTIEREVHRSRDRQKEELDEMGGP